MPVAIRPLLGQRLRGSTPPRSRPLSDDAAGSPSGSTSTTVPSVGLLDDPAAHRRRLPFFATPAVTVAGRRLSPNAIEHGLLRRSAFLAGLGYLRNPFPSRFERMLRVERVDPRIHFALNCGARSCPPFAAWQQATLDTDLERATAAYLVAESARSADRSLLTLPRLLRWYRGDFGGRAGFLVMLRRHGVIGPDETPRLRYGDYDWSLDVDDTTRR